MTKRPIDRLVTIWPRVDAVLFVVFAGACILYSAVTFYGSLFHQTKGAWSAPLDDVFIHFDYARATARGYPFTWSEGNGFSSGNTSLTYPFALALGHLVGFRGTSLMLWAAIVASLSLLGFFLAVGQLTAPLGRWAKYLVPPAVLSVGALDWSLWSGMENAFHLGVWGLCLTSTLRLIQAPRDAVARRGWLVGLTGALLFATRPESVVCVAALGGWAALEIRSAYGSVPGFATLLRSGIPGGVAVLVQAVANRVFTGEWAANGAIAKLTINDPYMPAAEKLREYLFLLKYVVVRNTHHHFAETGEGKLGWGMLIPVVGALPLFARRTRRSAIVLWVGVLGWLALVAMNRQVRWQNERYTMAAVAWVLVLFAMGLALLVSRVGSAAIAAALAVENVSVIAAARTAFAVAIAALWCRAQLPQMRDQIWFFGRASRNILDQQLAAGARIAELGARRALVGDAGALMYASDVRGLDLIGLGGYRDFPFARAAVHGLGASLELIERLPAHDRPDLMAIYPSWWGDLPTLFGRRIQGVKVFGNVICGDAEKVLYAADWTTLDRTGRPRNFQGSEHVLDELDVADLISERMHGYEFPHPSAGFVDFRVLADPVQTTRDLFDAGRVIPAGMSETARLKLPGDGGRLLVRTATGEAFQVEVRVDGKLVGTLAVKPGRGWLEPSVDLPPGLPPIATVALTPVGATWFDAHVWILEGKRSPEPVGAEP